MGGGLVGVLVVFHCTFFSSDAEWFASARPGVERGSAGLVLGWLGWGQTGWAGVGLVGPVLDWLGQCRSSCAGVSPVVPVAGRRWRSRTVPWCSKAVLGKRLRVLQADQLYC